MKVVTVFLVLLEVLAGATQVSAQQQSTFRIASLASPLHVYQEKNGKIISAGIITPPNGTTFGVERRDGLIQITISGREFIVKAIDVNVAPGGPCLSTQSSGAPTGATGAGPAGCQ